MSTKTKRYDKSNVQSIALLLPNRLLIVLYSTAAEVAKAKKKLHDLEDPSEDEKAAAEKEPCAGSFVHSAVACFLS